VRKLKLPPHRRAYFLVVGIPLLSAAQASTPAPPHATGDKRPATVSDSIRMTHLADPNYTAGGSSRGLVAHFSPDGKQFVVVLRKGNLEQNTNEYSLLLFRTADAFQSPKPEVLLTLSSSSNREAISRPTWLDDNETILFLGENPSELRQLYSFKCSRRKLERLTNYPTSILSYAANPKGDHIVILAEKPVESIITERARREGIVIAKQWVSDLIAGVERESADDCDLLVKTDNSSKFESINIAGELPPVHPLYLSPDGRYLVILPRMPVNPQSWRYYKDELLQRTLKGGSDLRYVLVDLEKRTSQPLLDAPISPSGPYEALWLADSLSIAISGTYLPLNISDPDQRKARESNPYAAEIKVPSGEIVPIAMRNDLKRPQYDRRTGRLTFEYGRLVNGEPSKVAYRKIDGRWEKEKPLSAPDKAMSVPEIRLDEDANSPPTIVAVEPNTRKTARVLDLNPWLHELRLAHVERIVWKATDGHEVDGGLYHPPAFIQGKQFPLIIQTHGFNPERFSMDGRYTTAFAAQALANKGFLVVQANEGQNWGDPGTDPKEADRYMVSPQENPREMASYEGLIDHLDNLGLIDRTRVGIIGFSRTCMHVQYALTHSKYKFAAASLNDGIDAGYFGYIAYSNAESDLASEYEQINGGAPFGKGLAQWMQSAPGFQLEQVQTPIRLAAIRPGSLLGEWEWFSGLLRLRKPVELVYLPEGEHILEKPWERLISQQGNVDWFRFWLQGYEDPDPAKAEQYARWRELRKLQQANNAGQKTN